MYLRVVRSRKPGHGRTAVGPEELMIINPAPAGALPATLLRAVRHIPTGRPSTTIRPGRPPRHR